MSRTQTLRAEAQKLYGQAANIKDGDERLVFILRALELQTEAEAIEREGELTRPLEAAFDPGAKDG